MNSVPFPTFTPNPAAEELHAIQAMIAGQGVGICSNILVRHQLASGELVRVLDNTLDGYGFFFVNRRGDTRKAALAALRASLMTAAGAWALSLWGSSDATTSPLVKWCRFSWAD